VVRIFSQGPLELELPRLLAAARTHFSADLEVLSAGPPPVQSALLRLASASYSADFQLSVRAAEPADHADADLAERAGGASGMAGLARRCLVILELRAAATGPRWDEDPALLKLCAIIASVTLGPVLPPDRSTLLGVRSSMERLERALGKS